MATQLVRTYGTPATITCTLASLAYTAGRETDTVTLSATAEDYEMIVSIKTSSAAHAGDMAVYLYACPSPDGTAYPSPAAGTDAAIVIGTAAMELKGPILTLNFGTASTGLVSQIGVVPSIKTCLGELPQKMTFALQNNCALLTATAGDHYVKIVPVWNTVTT